MSDKTRLLNTIKKYKNCKILEVGVAQGNTAELILKSNKDVTYLGVDPWTWFKEITLPPHNLRSLTSQDKVDEWYEQVITKLEPFKDRAKVIRGFSKDILPSINEKFDVIHIDGDHTYSGCKWDCDNVIKLLKEEGTIVVDDVNHWEGCTRAWKEFKKENPNLNILP